MATTGVDIVVKVVGGKQVDNLSRSLQGVDVAAKKASTTSKVAGTSVRKIGAAAGGAIPGVNGLGAALSAALGPLAAVTSAAALVSKALSTAFERGAAEQKLRNFTDSAREYEVALAVAADTASKFGMSQTEATAALGDTYSRLKGLGFGLKETSEIYNGFQSIVLESGTTAEDAAGAFLQLSQALGSGKLQGDELRAILERMPQLAQRIAKTMGVSAAEIREMGRQGKITSEVIYKALAEAGSSADEFGNKLNAQQTAMKSLGAAADQAFALIGNVFSPAVTAAAEAFSWVLQKINEFAEYLGKNVMPQLEAAVKPVVDALKEAFSEEDLEYLVNVIQNYFIKALEGVVIAVQSISTVLAAVIRGFKALAETPVFKTLLGAIGAILDKMGLTVPKVQEFKEEQEKVTKAASETVDQFSSMPEKVESVKAKSAELAAAQSDYLSGLKEQTQEIQLQAQQVANQASIEQARIGAAQSLNDLERQRLETFYEQATSQQAAKNLAIELFNNAVRGANLEKQAKLAALETDIQKSKIQQQIQESKYLEIQAEGELQKLKAQGVEDETKRAQKIAEINGATKSALDAQTQVVKAAAEQVGVQKQIAEYQSQSAEYQRQGKIEAAATSLKQKLISEKVGMSNQAAGQLTNNLKNSAIQSGAAATSSNKLATGLNSSATSANKTATMMIRVATEADKAAVAIQRAAAAQAQLNAAQGGGGGGGSSQPTGAANGAFWQGGFKPFANGGYVNSPTMGIIGEGGGNEYVIPESRMDDAMNRWNGGSRGDAVVNGANPSGGGGMPPVTAQVSVTTGPVMNMNGSNYVSQKDFMAGLHTASQQGAEMALAAIQSNGGLRRQLGVN